MRSKFKPKGYQFVFIAIFIIFSLVITFQGEFNLSENTNQDSEVVEN